MLDNPAQKRTFDNCLKHKKSFILAFLKHTGQPPPACQTGLYTPNSSDE